MVYEDFTSYVEVDVPANRINVDSSTKVTVTDADLDETFYLYRDKGVNHFDGGFDHKLDVQMKTTTGENSQYAIWSLQNQLSGYRPCADALFVVVYYITNNYFFILYERWNNNQFGATSIHVSKDVTYYLKIKRDENVGTYGTLYLGVYSTSELRDAGDATDGDVGNESLVLHAKRDFQYIMAVSSFDLALTGRDMSAFSENLDLQEVVSTTTTTTTTTITTTTIVTTTEPPVPPADVSIYEIDKPTCVIEPFFRSCGWLEGWDYRKSHVINSATGAGTSYHVRFKIHYGSGIDNGEDVYLGGKCLSDFSDVRFTDDAHSPNFLVPWIEEKVNNDYAIIWVKILDDLSDENRTIYIYYGNATPPTYYSSVNGNRTFPLFDDFESGNILNFRRFEGNPILSSQSGHWDYGFQAASRVVYWDGIYWLYYQGAIDDPDAFPRKIGLATSSDGFNFTKRANAIFEGEAGEWDSLHTMFPAIVRYAGYFWLFYAGKSTGAPFKIGLAKSTDGINFTRVTNGIGGTSKVFENGGVGEWDVLGVQPCCVLSPDITPDNKFWLYYWSYWGSPTHVAIGLAKSSDGLNFTRITDGLDGTSKVLREEEGECWEETGPYMNSVFYYDGKFHTYYSGTHTTPTIRRDIGYAESDDGTNWTRGTENPIMEIGTADWESDYLTTAFFVFWKGDPSEKGLVYYTGAYTSRPTNRLGVFFQQIKDNWSGKQAWVDAYNTPVKQVVTSPVYEGTYAFRVASDIADSEFVSRNHSSLKSFAVHFHVRFGEINIDHYCYLGTEYTTNKILRVLCAADDAHLKYYNGTAFVNFPTDIIYAADIWKSVEIRVQIENEKFEVLWDGSSIGADLWDTSFTELVSELLMLGAYQNGDIYVDKMFVRKFVDPEPSHGSWGTEEDEDTYYYSGIAETSIEKIDEARVSIEIEKQ